MKRIIVSFLILAMTLVLTFPMALPVMGATPALTGNVEADFTGPGILTIADTSGDVGLPASAPGGTVSGWDMKDLRLTYDSATDTLYVGINTFVIAGDADGDGNPGGTSAWLAGEGGVDNANFSGTECFAVYFDLDQNGSYDVIAGVPGTADITGFTVSTTLGIPANPAFNFGAALPANTGSVVTGPDIEFTILNFSTLPNNDDIAGCHVTAFMGSLEDNGIGEDFIDYEQSPSTITTITPSADSVVTGGTVNLTITEENDGDTDLTNPQVEVTQQGAPLATLVAPPDSGDAVNPGVLDIDEIWSWTITSNPITADPTTFVATGSGVCPADIPVTIPGDPEEQDDVPIDVLFASTITTIESSADSVVSGDTVNLTITEENDGDVELTNPYVEVTQQGAPLATLIAPPDSGDAVNPGVLDPLETWSWTIPSNPITVNPTTFVATGFGTDPLDNVITFSNDPEERDSIPVDVLYPSTITKIVPSATTIFMLGEIVDLTITEENDGDVELTNPYVEVTQQGTPLATLVAPPDSGDAVNPGVLDPLETWSWTIPSNPIIVDPTTFVAIGFGTEPLDNVITFPGDQEERDSVTVTLDTFVGGTVFPESTVEILLPWIGILAIVVLGALVLARRVLFTH